MPKPKSVIRIVFVSALNLIKKLIGRVFFAVGFNTFSTPVVPIRAGARAARTHGRTRGLRSLVLTSSLVLLVAVGLAASMVRPAIAAPNTTLNFQARLEGTDGAIVPDGNYNVQFKLYNSLTGGTALWSEDHLNTASSSIRLVAGYLTVELGSVTAFPNTIPWDQSLYVTMNIGGTTTGVPTYDGEMNPRLKLTAVPYAFQAASATQLKATTGGFVSTLSLAAAPTQNNAIALPNASGTVCLDFDYAGCGFASASGSTGYIQNSAVLQGSANFNIQSKSATDPTAVIQAFTAQTADLLTLRNAAGTAVLGGVNAAGRLYYQSGSFTGTLVQDTLTTTSINYHLPTAGTANQTLCTFESGNCAGAGSGITGSGTANYVTRFNSASTINASSLLYDNNSFVGVGTTTGVGLLNVVGQNATQTGLYIGAATSATVPSAIIRAATTQTGDLIQFQSATNTPLTVIGADGSIYTSAKATVGSATVLTGTTGQLNVLAAGGASIGQVIRAGTTQTGNLLSLQNSAGTLSSGFNANGQLFYASGAFTGTLVQDSLTASVNYHLPTSATANQTLCTFEAGNCAGSGSGITGSGTTNYVARFNSNNTINASTLLFDNGSIVGVGGATGGIGVLNVQATTGTQTSLYALGAPAASAAVAVIRGGASPSATADLLDLQVDGGATVVSFDRSGNFVENGSASIGNGLTVLAGGASITGTTTLTGTTNINRSGTAATNIGTAAGAFSLASSGLNVTTAGALSGITTLAASGAITAATTGNTINGLIINGGALSGITGYAQSSGNFAITGVGTFDTGSGQVNLNGPTSVTGTGAFTTGTGVVTHGSLGAGLVQSNATGVLSSGAADRNSSTFFSNSLSIANGGTGTAALTANGILFGNGTSPIQTTAAAPNSILITSGVNAPSLSQTLPLLVQGNITNVGTLTSGSIASGFGSISTGNAISTTAGVTGNTVNAIGVGSALQLNGISINTAGTLSNVAYLNQANTFTGATNTFAGAVTVQGSGGLTLGSPTSAGTLVITDGATHSLAFTTGVLSANVVLSLPAGASGTTDVLCLKNLANCGTSGAVLGSGTINYIAKFDTGSSHIGNSSVYDNGTFVGINTTTNSSGLLTIVGASAAQSGFFVQAAASSTTAAVVIKGGATPAAGGDLLQLQDSTGAVVAKVDKLGNVYGASFDATSIGALNVGTTNATAINLKQNTTITGTLTSSSLTNAGSGGVLSSSGTGLVTSSVLNRNSATYFTGTLTVSNGGTGAATLAAGGLIYGNGTGAVGTTTGTAGQIVFNDGTNPAFTTLGGDLTASTTTIGSVSVSKLQGNTLTITAPASGQYLRYSGTAFVNSALQAADITGTLFTVHGGSAGNVDQTVASGQTLNFLPGTSNNLTVAGSATRNLTFDIVSNPLFTGTVTSSSNTTGFALTGAPVAGTGVTSLLQLGSAIANGNSSANGGTYIGVNEPAAGVGSAADFINLQVAGVSKFKVTNSGALTLTGAISAPTTVNTINGLIINSGALSGITGYNQTSGGFTISGGGAITLSSLGAGLVKTDAGGVVSSGAVDRNSSTYFNTTLTVGNGGTGLSTLTANGVLYAGSTSAVAQTAAGTSGQILVAGVTGVPSFQSISGDISLTAAGVSTVNNLQSNPLVITAPASGQFLRYDGTRFANSAIQSSDVPDLSASYIRNNTTNQATSNFNITARATTVAAKIQGASGQNIVNFYGSASATTPVATIDASGNITGANGVFTGSLSSGTASAAGSLLLQSGAGNTITLSTGAITSNITITAPVTATGSQTLCFQELANCTSSTSASGNTNYIAKFTSGTSLGSATGNAGLYDDGTFLGVGTISNNGLVSIQGATTTQTSLFVTAIASATTPVAVIRGGATPSTGADLLQLQNNTGTPLAKIDAAGNVFGTSFDTLTAAVLHIGQTNATSIALDKNTTVNGTLNAGATTIAGLTNTGSTLNSAISFTNFATGGSVGTAAATVDVATTINITQTTPGQTLTLASPTVTTAGRIVYINNTGTTSFTMYGAVVAAGQGRSYEWNGTAWTLLNNVNAGTGLTQSGNTLNSAAPTSVVNDTNIQGSIASNVLTLSFAGTLSTARGGTGLSSYTSGGVLYASSSSALAQANGTSGQVLLANGSGIPTFTTLSGDVTVNNIGATNVSKIQGTTFTLTAPTTGQYLRYNGTAFINDALQAADITGTLFSVHGGSAGNVDQTVASGQTLNFVAGTSNNLTVAGGATRNLTFDIVSNPTFTGKVTAVGVDAGTGVITGTGGATLTGTTNINVTGASATTIGSATSGAFSLNAGAASTISTGVSTLVVTSSNFNVAANGNITAGTLNSQTIGSASVFTGTVAVQGANALTLGTTGTNTGAIVFKGATAASGTLTLIGPANPNTGNFSLSIPAITANQTVCVSNAACAGYTTATDLSGYVQLQSGTPGTAQTGNLNIGGTAIVGTLTAGLGGVTTTGALQGASAKITGLTAGLVKSDALGNLTSGALDRNSSTYFNTTLNVSNGGTGISSLTTNSILYANSTSSFAQITGTSGQVLLANATGVPTFTTLAGDLGLDGTGATTVNKIQGTTFTISSPTTAQYLRYNGTAFVNAALGAADITGTLFSVSGSGANAQAVTTGQTVDFAPLSGGSGNITVSAGITRKISIDIINNPIFTGLVTASSGTTGLALTGTPTAGTGITSLLQLGGTIAGGNSALNGGTYIGINEPGAGAGSTADFLNFQNNNVSKFKVSSTGLINTAAGLAVSGTTVIDASRNASFANLIASGTVQFSTLTNAGAGGILTGDAAGNVTSTTINRDTSTYLTGTLSVGNGGTGRTTLTNNAVLYGTGATAVGQATGTSGQVLLANGAGTPTFTTVAGDATINNVGNVSITKLQGNTLTITAPASGQYIRYNGVTSAFENSALQASDITGTLFSVTGSGANAQAVSTGQTVDFSPLSGGSGNLTVSAGATRKISIDITQSPTFTGTLTLGATGTTTGAVVFRGATAGSGTLTLTGPTSPNIGNFNLSIPAITANQSICVSNTSCAGYLTAADLSGYVQLQSTTPGTAQTGNLNISGTAIIGTLSVGAGGISTTGSISVGGVSVITSGRAAQNLTGVVSSGSIQFSSLTNAGAGGILTGDAAGNVTSSTINRDTSTYLTGTLSVGNGGSGRTTLTNNAVLYGTTTTAVGQATGTSGQVLLANGAGTPTFTTVAGDATINNVGNVNITKLQGSTLTITAPGAGQYLRYDGAAFVNSALQAADISGTLFNITGSGTNSQPVTTGQTVDFAPASGGSGNITVSAGITRKISIDITQSPTFTGSLTLGATGTTTGTVVFRGSTAASGTLTLTGPANPAAGNFSLAIPAITANQTICVSNTLCTGYLTAADLSGYVQLQSTTPGTAQTGNLNISGTAIIGTLSVGAGGISTTGAISVGGLTVITSGRAAQNLTGVVSSGTIQFSAVTNTGGTAGVIVGSSNGTLSSTTLDRNSSTYFNNALTVGNGGTGLSTLTTNGVLYANSTTSVTQTNGTSGQVLLANGSGVPTFTSLSGDVSVDGTGATVVNKIQGSTVTISTPTTGQYLRYSGTAFVNSAINVTDISGTLFSVTGNGLNPQTVSSGQTVDFAPLSGGSGNISVSAGATRKISIDITQSPTFTGALTLGATGTTTGSIIFKGSTVASGTLTLTGPTNPNTGNFSLTIPTITANQSLCVSNTACTGYLTAADLSGYVQLQSTTPGTAQTGNLNISGTGIIGTLSVGAGGISTTGAISIGGTSVITSGRAAQNLTGVVSSGTIQFSTLTNAGAGGILTGDGTGVVSSSTINRDTSSYLTGTLSVGNGGTGRTTLTNNAVLYGTGATAVGQASGTSGQVLLANGSGLPTFTSFSGDVSVNNLGTTSVNKLQTNTLTITAPTTGQYIRYNGVSAAFENSAIVATDITGTLFNVSGSSGGTNQSVARGDTLNFVAGASGNLSVTAGAVRNVTIDITTTPSFVSETLTNSAGTALALNGTPSATATAAQLLLGTGFSGNAAVNGGTYLGVNAPATGAGSTADLLNLESGAVSKLKVTSAGTVIISTLGTGIVTANASGQLLSGSINRDTSTYLTGTLSVGNGGTGATTLATNGVVIGNSGSALSTVNGTANQFLQVPSTGGTPVFSTLSGDATLTNGTLTIANAAVTNAKLANSTITLDSTAATSNVLVNGTNAAAQSVALGSSITVGLVNSPTFTGVITSSNSATGLVLNPATNRPASSSALSLLQLGSGINGGSTNGTYIGINQTTAGNTSDFLNFQNNNVTTFKVSSTGLTNASGGFAVGANTGATLSSCTGYLSNALFTGGIFTSGSCASAATTLTLQSAYDNSGATNPQITLTAASGGIKIADNATTLGTGVPLLDIENNGLTTHYFSVFTNRLTTSVPFNDTSTGVSTFSGETDFVAAGGTNAVAIPNGTLFVGPVVPGSATYNQFAANSTNLTQTFSNSTGSANTLNVVNNNSANAVSSINGKNIALSGAINTNGSFNNTYGLNLTATATTGNNFYGLNLSGTGFKDVLTYNGTQLISGNTGAAGTSGRVQNAAFDATQSYTNITKVGTLTVGSISPGFGAIATNQNITTSLLLGGGTLGVGSNTVSPQFSVDATGNTSITNTGSLNVGPVVLGLAAFSVAGTGALTLSGASSGPQLTLTPAPTAGVSSSLIQIGTAISAGATNGTYIGINAAAGNTADFLNFQNAGASALRVTSAGALTAAGALQAASGSFTNALSAGTTFTAGTTINAGTAYKIGGSVGIAGQFLRSDGATGFVASTLQTADGTGVFLLKAPTTTTQNTITPGAGVVGLTVQGVTSQHIADFSAGAIIKDYFDVNGSLNVGASIQALSAGLDIGTSTTNFQNGYFGTALYTPIVTTIAAATANGITVQPGNSTTATTGAALSLLGGNSTAASSTGGTVSVDAGTGTTANGVVNIGTTNATKVTVGGATNTTQVLVKVINNGITLNNSSLLFDATGGTGSSRTFSIAAATGAATGDGLVIQAGTGSTTGNTTGGALTLQAGAGGGTGASGTVLVKARDAASTTTFQIQNSASVIYFNADSVNQRISIGTSTSLTAPTLAGAALLVTKAEVQGGVLFGSSTNYVSSNGSNQLRFTGTARNSINVTLAPEFAGATMSAAGSGTNIGTMTSDFCSNATLTINTTVCNVANDVHNYYSWKNTQVAAQDYDIFTRWQVPSNFDTTAGTLPTIQYYSDRVTTSDAVTMTVYATTGAATTQCGSVTPATGTANTWKLETYTTGACTITAGVTQLTFDIHLVAATSDTARIGEVFINYLSNF